MILFNPSMLGLSALLLVSPFESRMQADAQRDRTVERVVSPGPKSTLRDAIGCVSREANDRLGKIASSGDEVAFRKLATALLATSVCKVLRKGTLLHLEDTAIFSGAMCGRPAGETKCYWVPIELTD